MGVFLRSGFAHVDNVIPVIKAITWLLLSRLQGNKPHRNSPETSEPYLLNLRQHTPEPSEIFRNLPGLATPFYTGTLRNLPEPASGTYTILQRNSPEPSGTCLRNLHQHTPELSGTFRNLPPEPAPATRTGTHRSLSGLKTPLAYAVGEKHEKKSFTKDETRTASHDRYFEEHTLSPKDPPNGAPAATHRWSRSGSSDHWAGYTWNRLNFCLELWLEINHKSVNTRWSTNEDVDN